MLMVAILLASLESHIKLNQNQEITEGSVEYPEGQRQVQLMHLIQCYIQFIGRCNVRKRLQLKETEIYFYLIP